jgi:DNA segregation ATPase FtsK/SpoIIIE, S-DNA-T family
MSGKGSRSSSGASKGSSRGAVKTPPKGNKRPAAKSKSKDNADSAAREVVRGREVEFWGIGLISTGIVFVLAMYLRMAGPLGRGIDTTFGWLLGLGRFALPVVVIGVGVAMVRRRSVEHRVRLAIGWTVVVLAILGLLHVMNGADKIVADVDAMSQAGGWFGAVIGEPLRSTLSWAGAWVVLIAIGTAGAMLVTDTTLPELIAVIRTWSAKISGPAADAARTATTNRDRGFDVAMTKCQRRSRVSRSSASTTPQTMMILLR